MLKASGVILTAVLSVVSVPVVAAQASVPFRDASNSSESVKPMTPAFAKYAGMTLINTFANKPQELEWLKQVGKFDDRQVQTLVRHAKEIFSADRSYQQNRIRQLCANTRGQSKLEIIGAALNSYDADIAANQERLAQAAAPKLGMELDRKLESLVVSGALMEPVLHQKDWRRWLAENKKDPKVVMRPLCGAA